MKLKRILGVVLAIGIVLTSTITVEAKPGKKVHPPIFNTYTKGQFRVGNIKDKISEYYGIHPIYHEIHYSSKFPFLHYPVMMVTRHLSITQEKTPLR